MKAHLSYLRMIWRERKQLEIIKTLEGHLADPDRNLRHHEREYLQKEIKKHYELLFRIPSE